MTTETKSHGRLILELKMAHQKFLSSSLGRDLKNNSKPELSPENFVAEMSNIDVPISVKVYEGRKG